MPRVSVGLPMRTSTSRLGSPSHHNRLTAITSVIGTCISAFYSMTDHWRNQAISPVIRVTGEMAIFRQLHQVGQPVECRQMRRVVALALLVIALVSTWLVYSKVAQGRREASYRAAMVPFQRDLRLGMERDDVQKYLDSHNVTYNEVQYGGSEAPAYEIKIGEEPGSFVCDPWAVYVALEFTAADKLHDIHI